MTDPQYRAGECNEKAGFLFPHACGRASTRECGQCAKPICEQHLARGVGDGTLCTSCGKVAKEANPPQQKQGEYYDPDPYFYADEYYEDYYWGRNDFTENDEAVLNDSRSPNDLSGFENDMGAS
ncbi:MAG: hypothetical protein AB8G99_18545 [Planctomycetaceae bacterium]